jgi:hypothetical protein
MYLCDVYVCFGSRKRLHNALKNIASHDVKEYEENLIGKSGMFVMYGSVGVIWMEETTASPRVMSYLAHEIFHCAAGILDRAGVSHTDESEEAYAYLIGWLTRKIYSKIQFPA